MGVYKHNVLVIMKMGPLFVNKTLHIQTIMHSDSFWLSNYLIACIHTSWDVINAVVSLKSTNGWSTLEVCQRGGGDKCCCY